MPELHDQTPPAASTDHRAGFIALIGRPNVGKSTLLNRVLGMKLAAVSNKPQTTRNRIVGIHNAPGMQAVLIDTPGLHDAKSRLNRALVDTARSGLAEADVVCWLVDAEAAVKRQQASRPIVHKGHEVISQLIEGSQGDPDIIVLNKVDRFKRGQVLPIIQAFHERFPTAELIPISALKGENVDRLMDAWRSRLPEGPPMYPEDQITESSERFLVTELIREKIFRSTHQEIPYATAVEVEKFEEKPPQGDQRGVVVVYARIVVERSGQKGVIIGKGGQMLKRIGASARTDVEALLGTRVHLDLHVAVEKNWTENPRLLHELGIE
jgi:GTP-binding protein Era